MMKFLNCKCADAWGDYAPLVLRLAVGFVFLAHGYQKLMVLGVDQFAGFLGMLGVFMPSLFSLVITMLEVVGGVALILGLLSHIFAKLFAFEMLAAFFLVHMKNGVFVENGGYELVLVLFVASSAIMILGSGKWALDSLLFKGGDGK